MLQVHGPRLGDLGKTQEGSTHSLYYAPCEQKVSMGLAGDEKRGDQGVRRYEGASRLGWDRVALSHGATRSRGSQLWPYLNDAKPRRTQCLLEDLMFCPKLIKRSSGRDLRILGFGPVAVSCPQSGKLDGVLSLR